MMKSPEIEQENLQKERRERGNSGFSEKIQAKLVEGSQMDLGRLRKTKALAQTQIDKIKILTLYKKISEQMYDLINIYLRLVETDLHQAQRILGNILKRQALQEKFLRMLLGKEESLNTESLEKELNDLGS